MRTRGSLGPALGRLVVDALALGLGLEHADEFEELVGDLPLEFGGGLGGDAEEGFDLAKRRVGRVEAALGAAGGEGAGHVAGRVAEGFAVEVVEDLDDGGLEDVDAAGGAGEGVGERRTSRGAAQASRRRLSGMGVRVLGAALNAVEGPENAYGYYGYYYSYYKTKDDKKKA
jgi:hypothetical protein